jgi:hypothetical protein
VVELRSASAEVYEIAMTSRRRNRKALATLFLTALLCAAAALFVGKRRAPSSELLQTASSRTLRDPLPPDEYDNLRAEVLNEARVLLGPKLKNPAISSSGLPLSVLRALQDQRTYLETRGTVISTALKAARLTGDNSGDPSPPQRVTCHKPMIRSVNGKTKRVVFTPTAANNIYRIEGCFFGDVPGIVQLEAQTGTPEAESVHPITMQLESTSRGAWSDHELKVKLDTELRGLPDYPVTLVIYPAKRRRIELRGCHVVAARGNPQLLNVIPSAWVNLYPSAVGSRSIRQLEYVSPTEASGAVPKDATAASALVVRSDPEQFGIGRDSYDFSHLNPGWVVESVQLQTYRVSCPEIAAPVQSSGGWEAAWTPLGVSVAFQETVCPSTARPSFASNLRMSQYAIRVWVVGPVGTQPLALVR